MKSKDDHAVGFNGEKERKNHVIIISKNKTNFTYLEIWLI